MYKLITLLLLGLALTCTQVYARQGHSHGRSVPSHMRESVSPNFHSHGRIREEHYRTYFGPDHRFRPGLQHFEGGYYRFNYGGYYFGYTSWPFGWGFNDDCYIIYDDGCDCYWMYDILHPGMRISVVLF